MATNPLRTTPREGTPVSRPATPDMHPRICAHELTGTVAWPRPHDPRRWGAAVATCPLPACVAAAASWVKSRTGHVGVYRARDGIDDLSIKNAHAELDDQAAGVRT